MNWIDSHPAGTYSVVDVEFGAESSNLLVSPSANHGAAFDSTDVGRSPELWWLLHLLSVESLWCCFYRRIDLFPHRTGNLVWSACPLGPRLLTQVRPGDDQHVFVLQTNKGEISPRLSFKNRKGFLLVWIFSHCPPTHPQTAVGLSSFIHLWNIVC